MKDRRRRAKLKRYLHTSSSKDSLIDSRASNDELEKGKQHTQRGSARELKIKDDSENMVNNKSKLKSNVGINLY